MSNAKNIFPLAGKVFKVQISFEINFSPISVDLHCIFYAENTSPYPSLLDLNILHTEQRID